MTTGTERARPIHTVGRSGSPRLPLFRLAAIAVACFGIVNVLWLIFSWNGAFATQALTDISGAACASLLAVVSFAAWRNESGQQRRPWGLLALAGASWASGEIIWSFYELVVKHEVPFPSTADIGFLAGYPLAALAIMMLPGLPRQLSSRIRTVLDGLLLAMAVLFVGWATLIGPLYRAESGSLLEQAIGLAYPVADLMIAAIALFVIVRAQRARMTLVLFGSGLLALAVADTAFAYLTLINKYSTGIPTDAAWNMGYLLIALAALRHDPAGPRPERNDEGLVGLLLPYGVVLLAIVMAGIKKVQDGTLDNVLFWGTLAIVMVVVVRQLITLLDNMSLTRNLETKVRDRTADLQRSEERHRSLVQNSTDVVTIVDADGIIRYESPASTRVFGYPPEGVIGKRFLDVVHPDDRSAIEAYLTRFMMRTGEAPVVEWRIKHGDGAWRYCESIGANLLHDPSVAGFVFNTRDVSERKELELQLRHEAFHDQLTGAANRALFRDRAEQTLKRAARNRKPVAVLYCDLDNLKTVNDTYGHETGDKLLTGVATRFAECVRGEDTVARLGGDEFAILLTDSDGEGAVRHVASRLLQSLSEPFEVDGNNIKTSVSIGIALSWGRQEVDELLRNADLAMYGAKNAGKARYELFEATVHDSAQNR